MLSCNTVNKFSLFVPIHHYWVWMFYWCTDCWHQGLLVVSLMIIEVIFSSVLLSGFFKEVFLKPLYIQSTIRFISIQHHPVPVIKRNTANVKAHDRDFWWQPHQLFWKYVRLKIIFFLEKMRFSGARAGTNLWCHVFFYTKITFHNYQSLRCFKILILGFDHSAELWGSDSAMWLILCTHFWFSCFDTILICCDFIQQEFPKIP